jgi:hypothetical protein
MMLKLTTLTIPLSNTSTTVKCITALMRNFFPFLLYHEFEYVALEHISIFSLPMSLQKKYDKLHVKVKQRTAITWYKNTFSPAHKQCRPITGSNHTNMNMEYNCVQNYSTQNIRILVQVTFSTQNSA